MALFREEKTKRFTIMSNHHLNNPDLTLKAKGLLSLMLSLPKDFEEFIKGMEALGITVNREQKNLRFKMPGQKNFTRCNTLKGDYTEQAILERIEGKRTVISGRTVSKNSMTKVGLLIDIEAAERAGKGRAMSVGRRYLT